MHGVTMKFIGLGLLTVIVRQNDCEFFPNFFFHIGGQFKISDTAYPDIWYRPIKFVLFSTLRYLWNL